MSALQVEVADWELGCCGGPIGIGDRVAWQLLVTPDASAPERTWTSTTAPAPGPGWCGRVLADGPLVAGWGEPVPDLPVGAVRLRCRLSATWHGGLGWDDLPAVTGRITRIQVVSQLFEEGPGGGPGQPSAWSAAHGGRAFAPVPGSEELLDVDTAPSGAEVQARTPRRRERTYRAHAHWLVDLALDPAPSGG